MTKKRTLIIYDTLFIKRYLPIEIVSLPFFQTTLFNDVVNENVN